MAEAHRAQGFVRTLHKRKREGSICQGAAALLLKGQGGGQTSLQDPRQRELTLCRWPKPTVGDLKGRAASRKFTRNHFGAGK